MLFLSPPLWGEIRMGLGWGAVIIVGMGADNSGSWVFEGILVGISLRPCRLVELELALQQRPVFAAADSFRLVGVL